jgi:hypothetical protein
MALILFLFHQESIQPKLSTPKELLMLNILYLGNVASAFVSFSLGLHGGYKGQGAHSSEGKGAGNWSSEGILSIQG